MVKDVDLLLTKLLGADPFYLNELAEVDLHIILFGQLDIGIFGRGRLGLRNQYPLDLQSATVLILQKPELLLLSEQYFV